MRIWFALLVTPILALADQSVALSTVRFACANQDVLAIHAIHATFLVVTIVATLGAAWVLIGTARTSNADPYAARRPLVAGRANASRAGVERGLGPPVDSLSPRCGIRRG